MAADLLSKYNEGGQRKRYAGQGLKPLLLSSASRLANKIDSVKLFVTSSRGGDFAGTIDNSWAGIVELQVLISRVMRLKRARKRFRA